MWEVKTARVTLVDGGDVSPYFASNYSQGHESSLLSKHDGDAPLQEAISITTSNRPDSPIPASVKEAITSIKEHSDKTLAEHAEKCVKGKWINALQEMDDDLQ